ncbi:UNVERIFIED_CONTAM: Zinc finger CCCH domain-containing protein 62 [Sesamum calycinum]|uniref:Zinc finger CCCH domain-containing protein 62 n=1 Tax=Sesamum calycinum TaxID=2727403 RepID=A0AAW2J142_9LAMI
MTTLLRISVLPLLGISELVVLLIEYKSNCLRFINDDDDDEEYDDGSEWNNSEDGEAVDEDEECDYDYVDKDDEEAMSKKVIQFIRVGSDLQELKLVECKAYLRKHSLRVSGSKEECIERIKEHWRLKEGNGEAFYPRSSFTIDCTGDVCKGDVVLFNQKVYQKFDKMTRRGSHLGRRTVAGRIVKESYGVARQQHTFTVEVLWSRGTKKLAPLYPLLVKGRNLYKLKTFRQRWKNEKERLEVLAEKHKRGAAARNIRAMRKAKAVMNTDKSITRKGAKNSKHFHHLGPSGARETTQMKKNCVNEYGKALPKRSSGVHVRILPLFQRQVQEKWPFERSCISQDKPKPYTNQPRASASTASLPYSHPHPNCVLNPVPECHEFWHSSFVDPAYSHSKHLLNLDTVIKRLPKDISDIRLADLTLKKLVVGMLKLSFSTTCTWKNRPALGPVCNLAGLRH